MRLDELSDGDTYAVKSSGPSTDPWGTPEAYCVAVDK